MLMLGNTQSPKAAHAGEVYLIEKSLVSLKDKDVDNIQSGFKS